MRFFLILFYLGFLSCKAQNVTTNAILNKNIINEKTKLVVGIVVDQMRYDYLTRIF